MTLPSLPSLPTAPLACASVILDKLCNFYRLAGTVVLFGKGVSSRCARAALLGTLSHAPPLSAPWAPCGSPRRRRTVLPIRIDQIYQNPLCVSYSLTTANGNGEGKTRRSAQHEAGPIQPAKYALRGCQEPTRGPGS